MMIDKIVGVGKNYLDHAQELGDRVPEKPVLFLKPPSTLKQVKHWGERVEVTFLKGVGEIHHECEVVLRVGADKQFDAVSIGLDMTLRTRQAELKKNGHPWTTAKVFVDAAIVGPWIMLADFPDYKDTPFALELDGQLRQQAKMTDMIMSVMDILPYIESFFPLCPGDLIFTGTPKGVGAVIPGAVAKLSWAPYHYEVKWN